MKKKWIGMDKIPVKGEDSGIGFGIMVSNLGPGKVKLVDFF